ncbi:MAG: hypothetical protein J7L82_01030 [Staphylothermus sp.]|nr:hypothetical protein [Staphylothermus sp.]
MAHKKILGISLTSISFLLILIYTLGLFIYPDLKIFNVELSELLIKGTIYVLILVFACIIGYIGYNYLKTSPPDIEEVLREYKEYVRK